jgi:hypothetical protein
MYTVQAAQQDLHTIAENYKFSNGCISASNEHFDKALVFFFLAWTDKIYRYLCTIVKSVACTDLYNQNILIYFYQLLPEDKS